MIKSPGVLNHGDKVEVTSPIFASHNFTSGTINISETLTVPLRCTDPIENTNGSLRTTLICDDDDIFGMYVMPEV